MRTDVLNWLGIESNGEEVAAAPAQIILYGGYQATSNLKE